jgi:hypothetical protein
MKQIDVKHVSKDALCLIINKLGCDMVKKHIKESHTKEEVVAILKRCKCPILKSLFTGY